jgi:hypothetical protein
MTFGCSIVTPLLRKVAGERIERADVDCARDVSCSGRAVRTHRSAWHRGTRRVEEEQDTDVAESERGAELGRLLEQV